MPCKQTPAERQGFCVIIAKRQFFGQKRVIGGIGALGPRVLKTLLHSLYVLLYIHKKK
jgi:hypothetical protein